MDFLDPKKRKSHRRRLFIGYILMAIAVALGALVLLFTAYGFDVNRKTGEVIQNGIVFVDSKPSGAVVKINGAEQKGKTATRLSLPAGTYTADLSLPDYRDWSRTFQLEGGSIERLVYPLFIPKILKPADLQLYASTPAWASTSPDRRWLLVHSPTNASTIDQFDTTAPTQAATTLQIPNSVMSSTGVPFTLKMVDWSTDNKHVLLDRTYDGKHEFILFDRSQPSASVNLNVIFGLPITSVQLKNKRPDQVYLYDANGGIVRTGDVKNKTVSGPLLSSVQSFKTYNDNLIFYITAIGAPAGKLNANIMEDDKIYTVRQFASNSTYFLDFSQYDNHWYYAVGSSVDGNVYVYRDPLDSLKKTPVESLSVATILRVTAPQKLAFSSSSRFIVVQGAAGKLMTYDAEDSRQFRVGLPQQLDPGEQVTWMDGSRLTYSHASTAYVIDFDGSNAQKLTSLSTPAGGPLFDRDFTTMFTLGPSVAVPSRTALSQIPLTVKK